MITVAFILGVLALLLNLVQWGTIFSMAWTVWRTPIEKRPKGGVSFIPFVGGILGVAAMICSPWPLARWFSWTALLLDPTWLMALAFLVRKLIYGTPMSEPMPKEKVVPSESNAER